MYEKIVGIYTYELHHRNAYTRHHTNTYMLLLNSRTTNISKGITGMYTHESHYRNAYKWHHTNTLIYYYSTLVQRIFRKQAHT